MGAWDATAFGNDDALDWVAELEQTSDSALIVSTLEYITRLGEDDYLEAPEASRAVAAAETVAALLGNPSPNLSQETAEWVRVYNSSIDASSLTPLTIQALKRISSNSELKELYDETGEVEDWLTAITDLEQRLK